MALPKVLWAQHKGPKEIPNINNNVIGIRGTQYWPELSSGDQNGQDLVGAEDVTVHSKYENRFAQNTIDFGHFITKHIPKYIL